MKYVILDSDNENSDIVICGQGYDVYHSDLTLPRRHSAVVSAGHFGIENGKVRVWGDSAMLGISSHPEDVKKISQALGL